MTLIVLGIAVYCLSNYIAAEVSQGRQQIANAQQSVDQVQGLSQLSPISKEIGGIATGSAQQQINQGTQKANEYQILSNWLHIGGIILLISGIVLLIISFIRKKSS